MFGVPLREEAPGAYVGAAGGIVVTVRETWLSHSGGVSVGLSVRSGGIHLIGEGSGLGDAVERMREHLEVYEAECAALRRVLEAGP